MRAEASGFSVGNGGGQMAAFAGVLNMWSVSLMPSHSASVTMTTGQGGPIHPTLVSRFNSFQVDAHGASASPRWHRITVQCASEATALNAHDNWLSGKRRGSRKPPNFRELWRYTMLK
jgi:hypothetical protein